MQGESRQETGPSLEADQQSLPITYYFRRIPLELRKLVIETAALYDTKTAYNLCITCSEFHLAAEPALYRHLALFQNINDDKLLASLRARISRKGQTAASHTSSLSVAFSVPTQLALDIIQLCPKLEYLAFWNVPFVHRQRLRPILSLPLVSFSTYMRIFIYAFDLDFSALPLSLKYLELHDRSVHWMDWTWRGLSSLTGLTHIALGVSHDLDIGPSLTRLVGEWRNAERDVCVIRCDPWIKPTEKTIERLAGFKRVVMVKDKDPTGQWDAHVRGRHDDWAIALRKIEEGRLATTV